MNNRVFQKHFFFYLIFLGFYFSAFSQKVSERDSLLAGWHFEHTNYDVTHYELRLKINPETKEISGSSTVSYVVVQNNHIIQLDLVNHLTIDSVVFENTLCNYRRIHDSFFITLPRETTKGEQLKITVFYHGKPQEAKNAPWDGGFVFSKDSKNNPFIGVACQEIGAYSWWPTKALLVDKCDSADLFFEVPKDLQAISNGKLISSQATENTTMFHWKVSYPIHNYNISVTIGKFEHFEENYQTKSGSYKLSYYVLPENLQKAHKQFKQVKPMLKTYEKLFGIYPFFKDGFKLIEAPYLGMEHQSGIAYGNLYQNGYKGLYFSEVSKKFDFIIIHESGHEYWGNNVAMDDLSEMWIHEAFCTYTELLYIEDNFGKKYVNDYIQYWKNRVESKEPLVNKRFSNQPPTSDIYYKGALFIHTLRSVINNDKLFKRYLKSIQTEFALKAINTAILIDYTNNFFKQDLTKLFEHYLYETYPPFLYFTLTPSKNQSGYDFTYRWDGVSEGFQMPIVATINNHTIKVNVSNKNQTLHLNIKKLKNYHFEPYKTYFLEMYE